MKYCGKIYSTDINDTVEQYFIFVSLKEMFVMFACPAGWTFDKNKHIIRIEKKMEKYKKQQKFIQKLQIEKEK